MWEAWEYLSSLVPGRGGRSVVAAKHCVEQKPSTPIPVLEPEEVEVDYCRSYGPANESDSHGASSFYSSSFSSPSSRGGFRGSSSSISCLARGESSASVNAPASAEPNGTHSSGWSPTWGAGAGVEGTRGGKVAGPPLRLKEIQLQKLGRLAPLDREWASLYPSETEEPFEWPWASLTEEQIALGRLDFRKFIVLLSALSQEGGWRRMDQCHLNVMLTKTTFANTRLCNNGLQARCCIERLEEIE